MICDALANSVLRRCVSEVKSICLKAFWPICVCRLQEEECSEVPVAQQDTASFNPSIGTIGGSAPAPPSENNDKALNSMLIPRPGGG